MHSSIFHAPLQSPPVYRRSARQVRQRPSNGPKRSKKPARHPALSSAWLRRLLTPSERVGCLISVLRVATHRGADHQAYVLRKSLTVNNVRYPLWNEPVPLPSNPGTHYSYVQSRSWPMRRTLLTVCMPVIRLASQPSFRPRPPAPQPSHGKDPLVTFSPLKSSP